MSFFTMSAGVPFGAISANQPLKSKSLHVSEAAGTCGNVDVRLSPVLASARKVPSRTKASVIATGKTPACRRPATRSCTPFTMLG